MSQYQGGKQNLINKTAQVIWKQEPIEKLQNILSGSGWNLRRNEMWNSRLLHTAVGRNNLPAVKFLLDLGISPNILSNGGCMPIHVSATHNDVDTAIMKVLLERGARPNAVSYRSESVSTRGVPTLSIRGLTALGLVLNNQFNCIGTNKTNKKKERIERTIAKVKLLLKHGAKTDHKDDKGLTALHYAIIKCQHIEIIKDIVNNGAPIDAKINSTIRHIYANSSPLDLALLQVTRYPQTMETVVYLVQKGASINVDATMLTNILIKSKFDWTQSNSHMKVFEKLVKVISTDPQVSSISPANLLKVMDNILQGSKYESVMSQYPIIRLLKLFKTIKGPKQTSIVDLFLVKNLLPMKYSNLSSTKTLCSLLSTDKSNGIRLTETVYPFHFAATFLKNGRLKDYGFMAFSRKIHTAARFASGVFENENEKNSKKVILRLPISSIPPKTPWLWYTTQNKKYHSNVYISLAREAEVLLPPGTVRSRGTSTVYEGNTLIKIFDVDYIPDIEATSLNGSRIHRRVNEPITGTKKRKRI